MTREAAKESLIQLGIEEPTKEQIDSYLNQLMGETKKYSDRAEKGKKDAELVAELQAKLEAIEEQNLTDIEKANKEKESANKQVAELQAQMKALTMKNALAEKGIVGENADKLVASLGEGGLDVELLGQIIADRELEAANRKEKEIADNSTNPGGGSGKGGDPEKTPDVLQAESMANAFGKKADTTNQDYYVIK